MKPRGTKSQKHTEKEPDKVKVVVKTKEEKEPEKIEIVVHEETEAEKWRLYQAQQMIDWFEEVQRKKREGKKDDKKRKGSKQHQKP